MRARRESAVREPPAVLIIRHLFRPSARCNARAAPRRQRRRLTYRILPMRGTGCALCARIDAPRNSESGARSLEAFEKSRRSLTRPVLRTKLGGRIDASLFTCRSRSRATFTARAPEDNAARRSAERAENGEAKKVGESNREAGGKKRSGHRAFFRRKWASRSGRKDVKLYIDAGGRSISPGGASAECNVTTNSSDTTVERTADE